MNGDDRKRFCAACGKHVYNLTVMGPDETFSLVAAVREQGERRCVRVYQHPDGTLAATISQPARHGAPRAWQFTIRSRRAPAWFAPLVYFPDRNPGSLTRLGREQVDGERGQPVLARVVAAGDVLER